MTSAVARTGRDLLLATREFAAESRLRSWWHALSTLASLALVVAITMSSLPLGVRLAAAVLEAMVLTRSFVLYHDVLHGALLRGSPLARVLFLPVGLLVMAPPRVWRETHNYHHTHTAQLAGPQIGSFPTMTLAQWAQSSPRERRGYRIARHPATVLFGYFTLFMVEMGLLAFLRAPRKRWDSLLALLLNWGLSAALILWFGVVTWLCCLFVPLFLACAFGAYLFYVQHNFSGLQIEPRPSWSYDRAALESSSFLETGCIMRWFTASIGYHHVHHLNPTIPFYRLREAMEAIPELQNPARTSLALRAIAGSLRLKLWDPQRHAMVGFPQP